MILGIDEVGRGSWAGPLVVGAVVLGGEVIEGLTDSKKLSKKQREKLDIEIREKAKGIGLGWVEPAEIDEIGLSKSLNLATKRAVEQIKTPYGEIIIDGTVNFLCGTNKEKFVTTIKKADLLIPCVSAASIVAKVARDKYMATQDDVYRGYDFKNHVGYGTSAHSKAIDKNGATKLHRMSFAPLKKIKQSVEISTKQIGDNAEHVAADFLEMRGHNVIERNWKTKYCEIDIVSSVDNILYFTEVKYRKNANQGDGLMAITSKKLRQMKFAAKFYVLHNKISDTDLRLATVSLCGLPPVVDSFLEV
ncbi:MAG: ribonuclease HII [Candidatus Saccharibacteria bacterium]|nr:ribonuclease HII [Candidatus Saccharibacteria bacterium]